MLKINITIALLLFSIEPALAYLDPGSVSLWIQGILAGIAVIATNSRFCWFRLKGLVKKIFKKVNDK